MDETAGATREVTEAIEAYRFNDAARRSITSSGTSICDWYVEITKPMLIGEDGAGQGRDPRHRGLGARPDPELLHPFMPFITEELWACDGDAKRATPLAAQWLVTDRAMAFRILGPTRISIKLQTRSGGSSTWSRLFVRFARK